MRQQIYSLVVDNNPGVLSRVAGLFSRRGYNIDSITSGASTNPKYTQITVVATGDEMILSQIEKQVRKLEDVRTVTLFREGECVARELIMVKVSVKSSQRAEVVALTDIFRANVVDVCVDTMIVELTGNCRKLDGFLNLLDGYEVLEIVRTGITALPRGGKEDVN
jgi:acetolactate synthase-1/3 small subunit